MSGRPYEVSYSTAAGEVIDALPRPVRHALAKVLEQVAADPVSGQPYDTRWSPEFRTIEFGGGGLVTYVVSERRKAVLVERVIWTG